MTLKPLPSDGERVAPETRGRVSADHFAELDAARSSLETARQELQGLRRALDRAQHEIKTSRRDLEAARRDSLSSRELVKRGEIEIATLRSAFNCLRGKYFQLAAQRERLSEDLATAHARLNRATADLERLQRNLFVRLRYLPRTVGRALRHLPREAGRALRHLPRDVGRLVRRAFWNGSTGRRHGPVL